MNKKTWVWSAVVVALIVVVAGYFWIRKAETEKTTYQTVALDRGDVTVTITATGTLEAVTTVQVGSQVSGTIAKLYADFNSVVKEGDLLAQLDSTFLRASVNQQQANLDRAQAQLNEAQRSYDRTNGLFTRNLGTQADLDAAISNLESAKASLRQAQASLDGAKVNLKYSTIRAPISGVVISRNVDVGQTVAASLSAPTLFTIANDLRQMQVQASIDEADIGSIKVGQDVTFQVDAYPEDKFDGTLSQIRLAPVISQNVVTYDVIINVSNPDLKLMPGMTANVTIVVAHAENVLRAPLAAIRFTPTVTDTAATARSSNGAMAAGTNGGGPMHGMKRDPNAARIWTLDNGRPTPHRIIKGLQDGRYVVIAESDFKDGDQIIVGANGSTAVATPQGQNPFMPRMGGRGPGGH